MTILVVFIFGVLAGLWLGGKGVRLSITVPQAVKDRLAKIGKEG